MEQPYLFDCSIPNFRFNRWKPMEFRYAVEIADRLERLTGNSCRIVSAKHDKVIIERYTGTEWVIG